MAMLFYFLRDFRKPVRAPCDQNYAESIVSETAAQLVSDSVGRSRNKGPAARTRDVLFHDFSFRREGPGASCAAFCAFHPSRMAASASAYDALNLICITRRAGFSERPS